MDLKQQIMETTIEIFTTMVMMEVEPTELDGEIGSLKNSITGLIGLAGTHKGILAIHLPNNVAQDITSSFLGMEVDEINEDVEDAVGELANMLGGNVKSILTDSGRAIDLSLPSTISGSEYDFQTIKDAEIVQLGFKTNSGQFRIELQLEK